MSEQPVETLQTPGVIAGLFQVFFTPRKVLGGIGKRPGWRHWAVPLLVVMVIGELSLYLTWPIIQQTQQQAVLKQVRNNPDLSEEQKKKALEAVSRNQGLSRWIVPGSIPLNAVAATLVVALACFAAGAMIPGGAISFTQAIVISAYSFLVALPEAIIKIPLIISRNSLAVQLGPGVLLSEGMSGTFLGRIIAGIDFMGFWQVCILSMGMAAVGRCAPRKTFIVMLVVWVVWILIKAGLGGISGLLNPA